MEVFEQQTQQELSDDSVRQMLLLAERLREANGGELDEAAIQAVAEATGAPQDYVRLAARMLPEKKRTGIASARAAMLEFDPATRRFVLSGLTGALMALAFLLSRISTASGSDFYGTIMLLILGMGLWNVAVSRDRKTGAFAGALFGGSFFVSQSLFFYMFQRNGGMEPALLIPFLLLGALAGVALSWVVSRMGSRLGMVDPVKERQELLRQLVSLQDKLKSGEQSIAFLSVDVVGSTRIKATADPLSVEFTFNEYHQFVESVAKRHGGRVHSTAGDGVTLAFDHPQPAFAAAKLLQTGIFELNTFKNKVGQPLVLRCGVHSGTVMTPQAGDIKSINFAHVIDMAAHMQKAAPPGGIAVSDAAAAHLPGGPNGVGAEKTQVLDMGATIWAPRVALSALPAME